MLLQMTIFSSFLWLNSYIYHIFLIHSSVREYLGCLHILAFVNNAAMNVGGQVSFQVSVFIFFK